LVGAFSCFCFWQKPKAKSQPKGLAVIQSHSQKQLLPITNLKAPQTLVSPAFGSQNYPPATLYTRTGSFLFSSFPPERIATFLARDPDDCTLRRFHHRALLVSGGPPPSPYLAPISGPFHLPLSALISPVAPVSRDWAASASTALILSPTPGPGGRIHDGELDRHRPTQLLPLPA
jgi:hypothetical protein